MANAAKTATKTVERPVIEAWPVKQETIHDLFQAQRFMGWLDRYASSVVGITQDGRRCPFRNYLLTELGYKAGRFVYVGFTSTGFHDCSQGNCSRHTHVEHPAWLCDFIERIDSRGRSSPVTGREAAAVLETVLGLRAA